MQLATSEEEVLSLLYEFDDVFPHNKEKVLNYRMWAKKIIENGHFIFLKQNNKPIGMAAYYSNDKITRIGYISLIGVKSQFQGYGYGKSILERIISEMKKDGMFYVDLEVDKDNINALYFYKYQGFTIKNTKKGRLFGFSFFSKKAFELLNYNTIE